MMGEKPSKVQSLSSVTVLVPGRAGLGNWAACPPGCALSSTAQLQPQVPCQPLFPDLQSGSHLSATCRWRGRAQAGGLGLHFSPGIKPGPILWAAHWEIFTATPYCLPYHQSSSSVGCIINIMHLNHLETIPTPWSVEKLSSMKLVPGAKKG